MSSAGGDLSSSAAQVLVEREMLVWLQNTHPAWVWVDFPSIASELGLPAAWRKAQPDGVWKSPDGAVVIAECFSRIQKINPGQRRKLAADVLKLTALRSAANDPNRVRCLLVIPTELDRQLQGSDWLAVTIRKEVEVVAIELSDAQRQALTEAVQRQSSGQARTAKKGQA